MFNHSEEWNCVCLWFFNNLAATQSRNYQGTQKGPNLLYLAEIPMFLDTVKHYTSVYSLNEDNIICTQVTVTHLYRGLHKLWFA